MVRAEPRASQPLSEPHLETAAPNPRWRRRRWVWLLWAATFMALLGALALIVIRGLGQLPDASASVDYARDTFTRTAASGWAAADVGGSYSLQGSSGAFAVDGGTGAITVNAGESAGAMLRGIAVQDVDLRLRFLPSSSSGGNGQFVYGVARGGPGREYRAKVRVSPSGDVSLSASRLIDGRETDLGSQIDLVPDHTADGWLSLRMQVTGSNPTRIRLRVWSSSSPEPSGWQYGVSDPTPSLQVPGGVGVRAFLSVYATNPISVSFDDILATEPRLSDLAEAGPAGAPSPNSTSWYVSASGSDSNPGTSDAPWRTLQHAADTARGTVWIGRGTYDGFTLRHSGLTFAAFGDGEVVVSGSGRRDVIVLQEVADVTLRGLSISGATGDGGSGILATASTGVLIEDCRVRDNATFGIRLVDTRMSTVGNDDISGNEIGIQVSGSADGVNIAGNKVHDNNRLVRNTVTPTDDDYGALGINFLHSSGSVVARDNQLWGNFGPSKDFGFDGGAFEIFGARDVTIDGNVMWNNNRALETGTDGPPCENVSFTHNLAYHDPNLPGAPAREYGVLVACGSSSWIANNTLVGFDASSISIVNRSDYIYQGSLTNLTVVNNLLVSHGPPLYHVDGDVSMVTVDYNLSFNDTAAAIAYVSGLGTAPDLVTLQTWLSFDINGLQADPKFSSTPSAEYLPSADSPAIDRGLVLPGITDSALGNAPDIGYAEQP